MSRTYCEDCGVKTTRKPNGDCWPCAIAQGKERLQKKIDGRRKEKAISKKKKSKRRNAANKRRRHREYYARDKAAETEEEKAAKEEWRRTQREMKAEDAARQELARREMARRHLLPFIQRTKPTYKAGWFHKDLSLRLEQFLRDVIAEREPRLMLFVPPRHGKSLTASQCFPAWALGKFPHLEFMQASYAGDLQMKMSKEVQALVRSDDYQQLFPGIIIPKGHEAVSDWQVAKIDEHGRQIMTGGGLLAAGVGGPLTGRGFNIGSIDDPVKNREEADSAVIREATKSWYSSTFYTRAAPGAGILIIQTRWHDDDLAGWQLRQMAEAIKEENESGIWPEDADKWEVISYPAIATNDEKYRKKGEALHPERYSFKSLLKKKRAMAPRDWSALYQQSPVAEEGSYFTKEMIRMYSPGDLPPAWKLNVFAAGDLAISKREDADYTVFLVVGLDKEDNIWVLDARRDRWDTDEITDEMIDIQRVWKPIRFGVEKEKIAMAIQSDLNRKIREEKMWNLVVEDLHIASRDKRTRARPIQGRAKQGKVLWPRGALWVDDAINELLRFDSGVNDDYVDAAAWIGQMLADETFVDSTRGKKDKSWKDKLKGYVKGNRTAKSSMAA